MGMTRKEYNQMRYQADYRHSTASRMKSAANLLARVGCTVIFPDDYEARIDEYARTCPRRERIDWED